MAPALSVKKGLIDLLLGTLWTSIALGATHYVIDVSKAASRKLLVTAEAQCLTADCDFQMPVWNATYQIRDFAQHVTRFQAFHKDGQPLPHHLVTPSLWRVKAAPGARVRLRYEYFADVLGPFGSAASARHVFLNFAQILVYPVGQLREPVEVRFRNLPASWKIALELPERKGVFQARNYDELADAPAELSAFAEAGFTQAGKRLRVVVDADPGDYNLALLENTARKVASTATEIMQDAPFPSYTFIYHFRPGGSGGMEHANSTAIDARAPCRDCDLASVTAHEFFHLWNVKRIRPQSLEPIDYTRENITPSLWFSEGVTSTYAYYILLQSGLETPSMFLDRLGAEITQHEQIPARLIQSAEEASIAAWLERYPSYNRPGRSISYYLKGELAGYLLDLTIRHFSENRRSLDDVMRRLNVEYAQKGKFFEDTEAIERLSSEAAGLSLKKVFDRVVRQPAPIDWDTYLSYAGYRLQSSVIQAPALGVETSRSPGTGIRVAAIEPGSPAERAGLQSGDRIVSVNEHPVERSLQETLRGRALKPGMRVTLEVERRGRTESLAVTPEFASQTSYRIEEKALVSAAEKAVGSGWLRQSNSATKP